MNHSVILAGVREILGQGELLLGALNDDAYTRRIPGAFNASIGGHYRHCLDHFRSLIASLDAGELNYDQRARDPRIESERAFALGETRAILRSFATVPETWLDLSVRVRSKVSYGPDEAPVMPSTLGREIMYVVAHAIHHYALIGVMCGLQGVTVPAGFGVAPSTVKHHAEEAKRETIAAR